METIPVWVSHAWSNSGVTCEQTNRIRDIQEVKLYNIYLQFELSSGDETGSLWLDIQSIYIHTVRCHAIKIYMSKVRYILLNEYYKRVYVFIVSSLPLFLKLLLLSSSSIFLYKISQQFFSIFFKIMFFMELKIIYFKIDVVFIIIELLT